MEYATKCCNHCMEQTELERENSAQFESDPEKKKFTCTKCGRKSHQ